MGVHQVRNVELRCSYDKAFSLCIEALGLIEKCKIEKEDLGPGKIVARTGATWKTWGDLISFEIRKAGKDEIVVELSSRPAVRMTMVDYGKNLENVETITAFLREHSKTVV